MARFYESPNPTNDPNYLGQSKEPDRVPVVKNTSMGELFEGVGNLIGATAKAADGIIKENLVDDAHKLIDPIQAEHGSYMDPNDVKAIAGTGSKGRVRALQIKQGLADGTPTYDTETTALGYGPDDAQRDANINSIFPVNDRPLPPQASKEMSQLQRLQQAYFAGNLSDSYYNAQLVSVAKQLRAQYPGYRNEVDAAISQITGVQPANALRASLMRDIQFNLSAQIASASNDDKWKEKHRGVIYALGYDDNTPIETLKPAVGKFLGNQTLMKAQELSVNVNSPEAESLLSTKMGQISQGGLVAYGNKAQGRVGLADFEARARELAVTGADPKQQAELVRQMTLEKNTLAIQMRKVAYLPIEGDAQGRTLVGKVKDGDQKIDQIIAAQLRPWDQAIELIKSGSYSALQTTTDSLKYEDNLDMQNLRRAFPQSRVATAIVNSFPNNPLIQNQFLQRSKILPEFGKAIEHGLGNAILGGKKDAPAPTPSEAVKSYGPELGKSHTDELYKRTTRQYDLVISQENKNSENAAHVAKQFFTDTKFYDNLSEDGRMKLFLTMAAPSKTQFIKDLAGKDPEVGRLYQEWAQYAAADIWRRSSDNLQAHLADPRLNISFNLKQMAFIDHTTYDRDSTSQRNREAIGRRVNSINHAITYLRPIVGDDPLAILPALGLNPMSLREDDMAQKMLRAVGSKLVTGSEMKEGLLKGWEDFREKLGIDEGSVERRNIKEGRENPR